MATSEEIVKVGNVLNDHTKELPERFRALFTLMNLGGDLSVEKICDTFSDESELLKHEVAFCLGQMQNSTAIPKLTEVLNDEKQPTIVRHEAGEALGAIGDIESLEVLNLYLDHSNLVLKQTCELAVQRIKYVNADPNNESKSQFSSVDPAPAFNRDKSVKELEEILLDSNQGLFDRYRAMFSLRNLATKEAIASLVKGLDCSDSTLLRHEVAYVLGQIGDPGAIEGLVNKLNDFKDDAMVRHECAEALGNVKDDKCQKILSDYLKDPDLIVKQSCEIALDMNESETNNEFQYANTLEKVRTE